MTREKRETDGVRAWRTLDTREVISHPVLSVRLANCQRDGGAPHDFLVLHSSDWVNVVPITPDGQVVLINQWRHGIAGPALEIPGGLVDPGESPLEAGARELLEETGYQAREMIPLGWVNPNPALFDNKCHTFLSRDVELKAPQNLDEHEEIQVLLKPLAELPALVKNGDIDHSLVVSALALFWLHQNQAFKG